MAAALKSVLFLHLTTNNNVLERRRSLTQLISKHSNAAQPRLALSGSQSLSSSATASTEALTDQRPKPKLVKRPSAEDDEAHRAISELRNMFRSRGYDPSKYHDDDNDSDMEAGFDDIMREEKRSARIAQQKDEEEARLLEEEKRRMAKKRKMGH